MTFHDSLSMVRPTMKTLLPKFLLGALVAALALAPAAARAEESDGDAAKADAPKADAPAEGDAKPEAKAESAEAAEAAKPAQKAAPSGKHEQAHVLITRKERAEGRHEVALFGSVQVNGKFTEHLGTGLDYAYHLREAFAITAGGTWFARGVQSSFTETELIAKARQQPFTASALLLQWEGHAGLELSPIYGKFAMFDSGVVQFGLYLGTSLGVAQTRVQLRAADTTGQTQRDRTFGDTGLKPVGIFNAGFRMFLSEHLALKAEVRDTVFSDAVQTINGCTSKDLQALTTGGSPAAGCNKGAFLDRVSDGSIALDLVKEPSSDVLNNVAFTFAISALF